MSDALDKETYHNTRQAYNEAELEMSGRYDKWLLTLSGGALGLSITFIEKIAKNPTENTLFWLKISWACLVLSLLLALLSLVTSQSAIRENRQELDLAYSEDRAPRFSFPRWFTWVTNALNWGSLLLFITGIAFLCIFSFKNIDQSMTNGGINNGQKTTDTTNEKTAKRKSRGRVRPTASTEGGARVCPPTTPKTKTKK
ncbi:MAG: hypothetical protein J7M40_11645 [Planctomycetes bacterium]|nr:hypothetical protein [Planctomycetota bacterium]